jgi:hypothetical protein
MEILQPRVSAVPIRTSLSLLVNPTAVFWERTFGAEPWQWGMVPAVRTLTDPWIHGEKLPTDAERVTSPFDLISWFWVE